MKTLQENPCGYDAESLVQLNQLLSRIYDDLSRLTQITTPDNTITLTYDAASNPLTVGDNDSLVTFSYDGLNRVVTEGTTDLGAQPAVTLTSTYNAVGNRTQLDDTAPGTTLYEFDLAGRLTKLTTPASMDILLAYDPTGRLRSTVFPNGVISDYGYDVQGRLSTLTHTLGTNPSFTDFGYTYNPVGNLLSIIDHLNAAQTRTSTYDALQRLKTGGTTCQRKGEKVSGRRKGVRNLCLALAQVCGPRAAVWPRGVGVANEPSLNPGRDPPPARRRKSKENGS